jgi:hypothetical protein
MRDGVLFTPAQAETALSELQREMNRMQRTIRIAIQEQLSQLTGRSLENLTENRDLAKMIHDLLESHGLRLKCPECGHPAILRVSPRPGVKAGVFVFDHTLEGRRTFHGGRQVVPEMQLTGKPQRKKRPSSAADTQ